MPTIDSETTLPARGLAAERHAMLLAFLWWLVPVAFFFWIYADAMKTWFIADDFVWLGLLRLTHNFHDVVGALFSPAAQGTIRPWSDRGFFLLFESLFGLNSVPFRICVAVTMIANLTLLAWIARRITGSAAAGAFAALLWTANRALVFVVAWNSSYNQALCALFLLGGLALFIRYVETGRDAFWWWQVVVFTLGFGALEINVVYPALAAAYVLFVASPSRRRKLLIDLIPLFCISVVYFLVDRAVATVPQDGPYAIHVDGRIFGTLAMYWRWSLVPLTWENLGHSARSDYAILGIVTVALLVFSVNQLASRQRSVLFLASWYLITLAPVLPLPGHTTDYYVTIPLIGLSILGGWGVAEAVKSSSFWRVATLIPLLAYLGSMIPATQNASRWWLDRSLEVRGLVLGVQAAEATHPGQTIVLDGINSLLYDNSLGDSAVTSFGLNEAYLTPGARDTIHPADDAGKLEHLVMEPGALRNALTHGQVVVYSDVGDHLRNITGVWERKLAVAPTPDEDRAREVPRRIEVGNPLLGYLLGPEWLPLENGFRWMPRRATVRLGGPRSAKDRLLLEGYCPAQQLNAGGMHLSVTVNGISLGAVEIGNPESNFRRLFDMPPSLIGKSTVVVEIAVDRVIHEPGGRDLGLTFGTIAIE